MSEKKFEFKRKNNYQNEVIDWIKSKRQSHSEILFIPNENCIKGYYKGLVLFEKITDRCQNLVQRCSKMSLDEAVNELGHGMPRDRDKAGFIGSYVQNSPAVIIFYVSVQPVRLRFHLCFLRFKEWR